MAAWELLALGGKEVVRDESSLFRRSFASLVVEYNQYVAGKIHKQFRHSQVAKTTTTLRMLFVNLGPSNFYVP